MATNSTGKTRDRERRASFSGMVECSYLVLRIGMKKSSERWKVSHWIGIRDAWTQLTRGRAYTVRSQKWLRYRYATLHGELARNGTMGPFARVIWIVLD